MSKTNVPGEFGDTVVLGVIDDAGRIHQVLGQTLTYGPVHWADNFPVSGLSEADRAMQRGIALHNLDSRFVGPIVRPLARRGAHAIGMSQMQRDRRRSRRDISRAKKVYDMGGKIPRGAFRASGEFVWWTLIVIGITLILLSALGIGVMLIMDSVQSGVDIC